MSDLMTFELFTQSFASEDTCIQALFIARWPDGYCCPRCLHRQFCIIRSRRLPLYQCNSCHFQTSLIAGTVLSGSRTPLRLWFQALFLHARPQGISAKQLASTIGTTYKTAWLICHKIRHAMSCSESQVLLNGLVRINWGVYGQPHNPTIFRHPQEHPLLAGASISKDEEMINLVIKQVPDEHLIYDRITSSGTHAFRNRYVDPSAKEVFVVNLKFSRDRYRPLIQMCEQASQWINNTFNGIGPKHLQSYLDQFCFGFNNLKLKTNIFEYLVQLCANTPTLNYPSLICRENNSIKHKQEYTGLLQKVS
ncbi:transposase [Cohnella abietis]|uniref:transposase n=1 Tax=Cohnella abietis TaxID=2507935 RepID=UPI00102E24D3|nr:transposase [Cohnella abietis]